MSWSAARPTPEASSSSASLHRTAGRPAVTLDCDTCSVRGLACGDCVVSLLVGPPPEIELDASERRALEVLADGGLVPPLRLVVEPE